MIINNGPDRNNPRPGDRYDYKNGTLVVGSVTLLQLIYQTSLDRKVIYFMNGEKRSCTYKEFPHLIMSLPV